MIDLLMIAIFIVSFAALYLLVKWCEKEVNKDC